MSALELHPVFTWLYSLLQSIGLLVSLLIVITYLGLAFIVFGAMAVLVLFLVWWERKIAGHIQQRD